MPYSAGGKASGSPVFSDSSTRKTSGRMTRKLTVSTTPIVMIACQLRRGLSGEVVMFLSPDRGRGEERGLRTSPDSPSPHLSPYRGRGDRKRRRSARLAPRADDAVPFLGVARAVLLEGVPVGGNKQLHFGKRHRARRRRHVLARRMQRQRVGERLLADWREEPVHEELRGIGVRTIGYDAVGLRHC